MTEPAEAVVPSPELWPLWARAHDTIDERAEEMLRHLPGVRLGEDIEAVHDMRVWSRRLVAAMRVFRPCFPQRRFRKLLAEARGVTRALGEVRDQDVQIDYYRRLQAQQPGTWDWALDYMIRLHEEAREQARVAMLRFLDEFERSHYRRRIHSFLEVAAEEYRTGLIDWEAPDRGLTAAPIHGRMPFCVAAPLVIRQRLDELLGFEPYIADPAAVEELHAMRIAAKWLRYTMELFASAYEDGLKKPLAVVKGIQEVLGDIHDYDVRIAEIEQPARGRVDVAVTVALGLLNPDPVVAELRSLRCFEENARHQRYLEFLQEWRRLNRRGYWPALAQRLG